jgi:CRP/FNR family transcriptional regulator, cyclic AMP receptor protein
MQSSAVETSETGSRFADWLAAARSHGLLARLPAALIHEVVAGAQRVEYPKGAVGLRWDEQPVTGIVLRGTARSFLAYPDGGQITTRYLRPGDMVGVFAARQPRIARGLVALEPTELLMISAERMRKLTLNHAEFAWELVEELTTILNMTHRALYLRAFGSVRQRVAVAIMDRARLDGDVAPGLELRGTQTELATGAGTVREVVATVLQGFKRDGTVDIRRGAVIILDPERLAREADLGFEAPAPGRGQAADRAV